MRTADPLLTRTQFREGTFKRDNHLCVLCRAEGRATPAVDAHHIVERRLFPDEGYYLSNGASVCEAHHRLCESTEISCDEVRAAASITTVRLPPQFYETDEIDKWGNGLLPHGRRTRGELWADESVQRVLAPVRDAFTRFVKPPRTAHLPYSQGATRDDMIWTDTAALAGREVVVTLKMDGENTTIYGGDGYAHARRTDPLGPDPSTSRVKRLASNLRYDLPKELRIQAENLMGEHTIRYRHLRPHAAWFLPVFRMWRETNVTLGYDETAEWAELLGLPTVPELWRGIWDEKAVRKEFDGRTTFEGDPVEGYVVAPTAPFTLREHARLVAKYVRPGFRGPDQHRKPRSREFNAPRA